MRPIHSDIIELNQLAYRYAKAVDSCDVALLQQVFAPDGRLRSYHPGAEQPFADLVGHDQLAMVPNAMRGMYAATAHMMTNHLVSVDGEKATGEVLCIARHLTQDDTGAVSRNVIIRYVDSYVRSDGNWLIADRQIRFLWNETHAVTGRLMG